MDIWSRWTYIPNCHLLLLNSISYWELRPSVLILGILCWNLWDNLCVILILNAGALWAVLRYLILNSIVIHCHHGSLVIWIISKVTYLSSILESSWVYFDRISKGRDAQKLLVDQLILKLIEWYNFLSNDFPWISLFHHYYLKNQSILFILLIVHWAYSIATPLQWKF